MLDTGDGQVPEYIDLLKSVLSEKQIILDHIVVTHWHLDHIGGVGLIRESFNKGLVLSHCEIFQLLEKTAV